MLTASMLLRQAAEKPSCHGENSMAAHRWGNGRDLAGCSKRPDFSPAQPWRAETRLVPSKAAGEARTGGVPSGAHGATNKEHHVRARRRVSEAAGSPLRILAR